MGRSATSTWAPAFAGVTMVAAAGRDSMSAKAPAWAFAGMIEEWTSQTARSNAMPAT
jgi:hypothetical protein